MGNRGRNNDADSISTIPAEIRAVMDEYDIDRTWNYLADSFGSLIAVKKWKEQFESEFSKSSREHTKQELFVRFIKGHLEKPMNYLLFRDESHPTINKLLAFIVKDKLAEKRLEQEGNRNYYSKKSN